MQAGGREENEAIMPQVYHDRSRPLQKRILQAVIEMHH